MEKYIFPLCRNVEFIFGAIELDSGMAFLAYLEVFSSIINYREAIEVSHRIVSAGPVLKVPTVIRAAAR